MPILSVLLLLLLPLAALGFAVAVALGPFLAGLVFAFGAAVLALVAIAIQASRLMLRWRATHHWGIRHAH